MSSGIWKDFLVDKYYVLLHIFVNSLDFFVGAGGQMVGFNASFSGSLYSIK